MPEMAVNPEQERYRTCWASEQYREFSRGESLAVTFLAQAKPQPGDKVIDFGCGSGRGALMLATAGGMDVTMLDFADNCLDAEVRQACEQHPERIRWQWADLEQAVQECVPFGYCCDVLEHIPPDKVRTVLANILASARRVFFNISTVPDKFGPILTGAPLHLTVQSAAWWLEQLRQLGAEIYWSRSDGREVTVYCGAWKDAKDVLTIGKVNGEEDIEQQVLGNIRAGWKQAEPHVRQDREIILLAGGPSMADQLDEIRALRSEGAAIVTVNGAYHWALEHGLDPAAQVVLDARQFNSRFTKPVVDGCKYLIASQAHPDTLKDLPRENTYLWHSAISVEAQALCKELNGYFLHIPGGSTVTLRAILLLRMLGFWRLHLFGFDSCSLSDGTHHAYAQPENDGMPTLPVLCGGRSFNCAPWMLAQAYEFRDMVAMLGDEVEMAVYGDGLIAHMIATGARISTEKEH